jgi:hypothetical protein
MIRLSGARGFTIVELLIVGGVVFILLGGMTLVLSESGRRLWIQSDAEIVTLSDAQRALMRINEDLRNARQANLSCTTAATATCTTPPCLEFDPAGGGGRLTYQRTAGGLLTRSVGGATQTVGSGLSGFLPTCQANGLVKLLVAAQVTGTDGGVPYIVSNRVLLSQVHVQNP